MVSVTVEAAADGDLGSVRLEDETWALAIWATTSDFWKLADIEETDWDERRTLKIGSCANAPAWWSERDGMVYIHVGDDAEAYDFLVAVPLSTVHEILAQLELQELPRFRAPWPSWLWRSPCPCPPRSSGLARGSRAGRSARPEGWSGPSAHPSAR
jgi:hypothetical protein